MPLAPRPKTATFWPRKVVTGIMPPSPQLQGGEANQREQHSDDPEANDDLRLGPPQRLEVVVDGRHLEDALAGELEGADLDDDRDGLEHEEAADDGEHDLLLGGDRNGAEQAAEGE